MLRLLPSAALSKHNTADLTASVNCPPLHCHLTALSPLHNSLPFTSHNGPLHLTNTKELHSRFSVLDDFLLAEEHGLVDDETKQLQDLLRLAKDALVSDPQQLPIQLCSRLQSDHPHSERMLQQAMRPRFPCLLSSHGNYTYPFTFDRLKKVLLVKLEE